MYKVATETRDSNLAGSGASKNKDSPTPLIFFAMARVYAPALCLNTNLLKIPPLLFSSCCFRIWIWIWIGVLGFARSEGGTTSSRHGLGSKRLGWKRVASGTLECRQVIWVEMKEVLAGAAGVSVSPETLTNERPTIETGERPAGRFERTSGR